MLQRRARQAGSQLGNRLKMERDLDNSSSGMGDMSMAVMADALPAMGPEDHPTARSGRSRSTTSPTTTTTTTAGIGEESAVYWHGSGDAVYHSMAAVPRSLHSRAAFMDVARGGGVVGEGGADAVRRPMRRVMDGADTSGVVGEDDSI